MHRAVGAVPDLQAWTREAFARTLAWPDVRRVGLALVEGGGRRLRFTASDRGGVGVDWCHVDAYEDIPLNSVVRTGQAVHGTVAELGERYATFAARQRGTGTASVAAVPVVAAGQVLGGYVVFFERPQPFDEQQLADLAGVGAALGEALRRAQRQRQRRELSLADEPVPEGARVAFHEVPADPAAVMPARWFLRATLEEWSVPTDAVDVAVLCLSELVTNALVHAHGGCVVRVMLEDGVLTTTVRDGGTARPGRPTLPDDPLQVHGRGLQLVEVLSSRWGSELDDAGTTVWFVLDT